MSARCNQGRRGGLSFLYFFVLVSLLPAATAHADATLLNISSEFGHDTITSPLIRFAPEEPLIFVDGLTHLSGDFTRLAMAGLQDWGSERSTHFALSGRIDWKYSESAPDLDFGIASMDAIWRWSALNTNFGVGPSAQRFWVGGARFRDTSSLQADATKADSDGGFWAGFFVLADNHHSDIYTDFDSRAASLSLQRHWQHPLPGIDGIEFELGCSREKNARNFDDLSNRSIFARTATSWQWWTLQWSLSLDLQESRFDAPFAEGFPVRADHYRAAELTVTKKWNPHIATSLTRYIGRNTATLPLYESRYESTTVNMSWTL